MDTAIVGMAFRFPGASDGETFWGNLIDRKSSVTEIPAQRWDWRRVWGDPKLGTNKTDSKWGGFIDAADAFDNEFFGLLPKVVQSMDPQQRIMLELAWNCLEDACVAPSSLRGRKVAVVVGVFNHDYKELQERDEFAIEAHHSTGTATAVIANRVSHYFDLRGPSVPIDTACSSSLNAIHNAIQALQYDGCEMALAGGINLMLTPTRHISFSKMGMLSPTGTCKTFDDSADGYVRGEGAAFLLLKPLQRAIADGDAIHGVIKGSAVNHCGSTYTLTYPSPQAQAEVIMAAHERAGVAVDSLGFVELHGTGTPKGDPIEFEGLATAFAALARKQGVALPPASCGLSSVKTNIGHLEAAAGVAGVIKVLLAMRHRRLPPLQNFNRLNGRIALEGTPFYPLGDSRPWLPAAPGVPLRAGVSSFGFGGTNAHLILEEPPAPAAAAGKRARGDEPVLIVASAKTAPALQRRLAALRDWLRGDEGRTPLADLSRSLLLGRDALACRFACVAADPAALLAALDQALDAPAQAAAAAPDDAERDALQALLAKWPKLKKAARLDALQRLADAFRGGATLAWAPLFAGAATRPLRLPGYPFAGSCFWTPAPLAGTARAGAHLHPLLQQNVSVLGRQRFRSQFDGREFFLADHVVDGRPVLPGVGYLEMARAAASLALEGAAAGGLRLHDVVWQRPLNVGAEAVAVELELEPAQDADPARLRFRVAGGGDGESAQVYCRGQLQADVALDEVRLDLDAIGADCAVLSLDAQACYRGLAELGLQYGPGHRAIAELRLGAGQCLARIELPSALAAGQADYTIHPSTADAALQAAVALAADLGAAAEPGRPCLPFALDRLDVHAPGDAGAALYAWVRFAPGSSAGERMPRLDIDLIESLPGQPAGRVRLALRGLSLRPRLADADAVAAAPGAAAHPPPPALAGDLYAPLWRAAALPAAARAPARVALVGDRDDLDYVRAALAASPQFAATHFDALPILAADAEPAPDGAAHATLRAGSLADAEAAVAAWKARDALPEHVLWVAPRRAADAAPLQPRIDAGARSVFALAKALLRGPKRARFVHLVLDGEDAACDAVAMGGFYKTLCIEKPSFTGRVVQCPADAAGLAALVADELCAADAASEVRYRRGAREVRRFAPIHSPALAPPAAAGIGFRQGGAYLITGGMGALGLIVARHLCERYQATVYLTGRSPSSPRQQAALDELAALGGHAAYRACDIADRDDVGRMLAQIRAELGARSLALNGVLHSAGVIEDDFLLRKPTEAFARVVAPKTVGTWCLDQETRDDPLDLFVLFSSVTGVLGNVGQCDYAYGNAFEDAFAAERERLRAQGARRGTSVSVNWPYWQDGGMRLNDKEEEALRRSFGIVPLQTQAGLQALEYALVQGRPQLVVMPAGDAAKVREVLGAVEDAAPAADATAGAGPAAVAANAGAGADDPAAWRGAVSAYLAQLFASQLGISADFEPDRSFKDYGFDSVVMIDLIADLEKRFGTLPKTLFFEYQTLAELTGYFLDQHRDRCRSIASPEPVLAVAEPGTSVRSVSAPAAAAAPARSAAYAAAAPARAAEPSRMREDIAIVGLAGRYPQAETLEAFWDNLRLGRDCVEEIPADRPDIAAKFRFQAGEAARAKSYSRWGGFLRGVDRFDPLFFNISPKEAENIDPNERLFLEIASLAIEDAGYTPDTLAQARGYRDNPVGVYAGLMWGDYQLHGVDRPRDSWNVPHSFYWAVANRVSYQFNFSGPSLTIDTACSSSLTAIHLACQAIRQGEIDVAIAGAVNLSLHPNKYNLLSDMHFLSSDGRCRAFGEGGDGYVPGEGVGAVVLKPLSKAREDGDHIYGVIRGSSINHGGKASGFTVPNPKRQAALVQEAMAAAGVDPRHISYVEAHGTGTSLGDPIEIAGLSKAFAQSERQFCAIGSAKSNLGHLEAAAGIAGLTKVLLQMRHRSLAPSIHSDTPNPYIDFAQSPFRVQRALQPWPRPQLERDGARVELPRLAGISSFGAGGSNGHLIVEEYVDDARGDAQAEAPVALVLSARRDVALREMAERLAQRLEADPGIGLQDAAYTLQVGRIAMEFRLALVGSSRRELVEALRGYARHGVAAGPVWSGHRDAGKRDPAAAARVAAAAARMPEWLAGRDLAALAQAWVEGAAVDWSALHAPGSRRRVPLPGYAFQRQRYWFDESEVAGAARDGAAAALHPLLDANVSTLDAQAFAKTFRPDEFYLRDHRLGENRILPGVAYLEMALQAARLAAPGRTATALEDVRWHRPVVVNDAPQAVRIELLPGRGAVAFDIADADDAQARPYAQGAIVLDEDGAAPARAADVDLAAIAGRTRALDAAQVDAAFAAMGFAFGPSFRVFERLSHNADEALGVLRLPQIAGSDAADYALHPALLDGAIRVSLGVGGFDAQAGTIRVPVRLRRIELLAIPGERVWAHARRSERVHGETAPGQSHFDIVLCDAQGRVLVRIEQLTIQPAPQLSLLARPRAASRPSAALAPPATVAPAASSLPEAAPAAVGAAPQSLEAAATASLVELLAGVTRLAPAQIDPLAPLENYGIDSIMIAALNRELEARFGAMPKTLFFEYQELAGIAGYLAENHADAVRALAPAVVPAAAAPASAPAAPLPATAQGAAGAADAPRQAATAFLRRILGETVGLDAAQVDPHAPLENYGIDSVMIVKLTGRIEAVFGAVSKTLFFEYQDIDGLAQHLCESFPDAVLGLAGAAPQSAPASAPAERAAPAPAALERLFAHMRQALGAPAAHCRIETPVADWPLDAVNIAGLLHALGRDFENVDAFAPYRHATLAEWAATLQWRPGRADAAPAASLALPMPAAAETPDGPAAPARLRAPAAARDFRRLRGAHDEQPQDIAIVGLSGRYPGAADLHGFWQNLAAGRDSVGEIPLSRWDHGRYFRPDRTVKGAVYSKWGGFIDGVDQFDARFFNISAREAELIDPQERLFLQTAWECVEDGGYTRQALKGQSVGVFVGVMWGYYAQIDVSDEQLKSGRPNPPFSSIANRVSYFMNFNGPSMAVDTMCSSSLTAIHLACRAIADGDCDMALAGGVNLIVHPNKYQKLSAAQFLSSDGRCRAFGAGGDGYVPGEGVGAVMLKKLSRAVADGDHIYGVIKATSLNHGGKTNGYTVPNQVAQTNVIGKALERAGWDPRSIGYIEAHGTGTSLGDPIEIAGLTRAFAAAAQDRDPQAGQPPCRIGSVKSNIGHLESAAAIAGLTKILLQFRHDAIAPSLHASPANPNIDFARAPVRVVQQREPWPAADARAPRRAGLSSFGAGGANAHCLVEDYPRAQPAAADGRPALFVLSADSEERLMRYVERVIAFLERGGDPDAGLDLRALAYTSQVGREAMDERLAVVAASVEQLLAALRACRDGLAFDGLSRGSPRGQQVKLDAIVEESERDALVRTLVGGGRLQQLARAWVSILDIDWARHADALYPGARPRRVPFPTMPFLTQRYWVEEKRSGALADAPHPLIDRNLSTLAEQAYRKRFDGQEFYLRDHIVHTDRDRRILPGVAYLEMARAAGELAAGEGWRVSRIRNFAWRQPFEIAGAPDALTIRMRSDEAGLQFDIQRESDGGLCVDGELVLEPAAEAVADEWLDIQAMLARGVRIERDAAEIYAGFRRMGFHFGPSFQVTQARYRLAEGALCRLQLPEHLGAGLGQYGLHPSMLDAALRAGLAVDAGANGEPVVPIVPFALDELEIRHPLAQACYAHVVRSHDALAAALPDGLVAAGDATAYKYDIVVTDADGRVLAKLHGFSGRALVRPPAAAARTLQWFGDEWAPAPRAPATAAARTAHTLLAIVDDAAHAQALAEALPEGDRCVAVAFAGAEGDAAGLDRFDPFDAASAEALFDSLRERGLLPDRIVLWNRGPGRALGADAADAPALHRGLQAVRRVFAASQRVQPGAAVRLLYAYRDGGEPQPQHEAIVGYARSLLTVDHRFELATLCDDRDDARACARAIAGELDADDGFGAREIGWRGGQRHRRTLRALPQPGADAPLPVREGGAYLVTGGAGKLGLAVARWLATQCRARLLLTGRSAEPPASAREAIDALRALGAHVRYLSVDTADAAAVAGLAAAAEREFGGLHGVIHCAGVASDRSILDLDDAAFAELLAPKVDGLVLLDRATASLPLDFFVAFSSVSALIGDLGSGAYAVGNRFMDGYMPWRETLRAQGLRQGLSLSIGWPLWASGGMEISGGDAQVFGFSGLQALTEEEGLQTLGALLNAGRQRVVVAAGDPQRIARTLRLDEPAPAASPMPVATAPARLADPAPAVRATVAASAPAPADRAAASASASASAPAAGGDADALRLHAQALVVERMATVTKTPAAAIDARASFEQCGMDSVLMLELHAALRADFADLPKTALFEYDSAAQLAQYLVARHTDALRRRNGAAEPEPAAQRAPSAPAPAPAAVRAPAALPLKRLPQGRAPSAAAEAIAIVGIAGEFPGAPDLDRFWANLREGRDCLGPIPAERGFAATLNQLRSRSGRPIADAGGFLEGVDLFDPALFRMSKAEADRADPQLRVLLRVAWRALEDAAYTPEALSASRVGVFVGAMNEDFSRVAADLQRDSADYLGPGAVASELSNRLSFVMNFRGPSLTVATACSASLTALHLARQSLLAGDCEVAVVGGVNLSLHQSKYQLLHDMKVLSPDGHERTFDEAANGLVPSEGAGVLVLKPLGRALADGDQVHGVIRASRIGHFGTGPGQFMPSLQAMEDTVAGCIGDAGLDAGDIACIEAHGTGTELGDPIELKALDNALRRGAVAAGHCAIGSKAAIGHMEAASGVGSIIKVLLGMRHGEFAPCARLRRINSNFEHAGSALRFPDSAQPWPRNARGTRIAGVNSFGMGGANAFVVLESPGLAPIDAAAAPAPAVFALSARSPEGLQAYRRSFAAFLRERADALTPAAFADLAYSSQVGRVAFRHRLAVVAADAPALIAALERPHDAGRSAGVYHGDVDDPASRDMLRLLAGDAGDGFVDTLLRARDLDKLADLWARGAAIQWPAIHNGPLRRRVSFPGVPFEWVRCDLRDAVAGAGAAAPRPPQAEAPAGERPREAECGAAGAPPADWRRLPDLARADADSAGAPPAPADRPPGEPHEEWVRRYWMEHLGDAADTVVALGDSLSLEAAAGDAAADAAAPDLVHAVSEVIDAALTQSLRAFGSRHGIALETLIAAAWAVLLNRYGKGRYSQFGLLGAVGQSEPALLPVRVRTVGRQKMLEWLAELQATLLRKHRHASTTIERIGEWVGREQLFDSVVTFAAPAGADPQGGLRLASEGHPSGLRPRIELAAAIDADSLELSLVYRAVEPDHAGAAMLLEQLTVLLEGIVSNPERMPSALAMRTRAESRERFWKTMEATATATATAAATATATEGS